MLSGADTWVEIGRFAKAKEEWIKTFMPLKNGVPSHDTFQRVFGLIETSQLQEITVAYLESIMDKISSEIDQIQNGNEGNADEIRMPREAGEDTYRHLSMDGKEERGTGRKHHTDQAIGNIQTFHVYDQANGICLKSTTIERKTNEIPVAQELLQMMNLKKSIVTADAMHTQKRTCALICKQKGQYVLGLKGNQGGLLEEASLCFTESAKKAARKTENGKKPRYLKTKEKAHSQIETRHFYMVKAYHEPANKYDVWEGLKTFIMLEKEVENLITGEKKAEVRYYIASIDDLMLCAQLIRDHWGVENGLHWHLDYTFRLDENTTMDKNSYTNLGLIKKMTLTLLKLFQPLFQGKISLRVLRKSVGWETEKLIVLLFANLSRENIRAVLMKDST